MKALELQLSEAQALPGRMVAKLSYGAALLPDPTLPQDLAFLAHVITEAHKKLEETNRLYQEQQKILLDVVNACVCTCPAGANCAMDRADAYLKATEKRIDLCPKCGFRKHGDECDLTYQRGLGEADPEQK